METLGDSLLHLFFSNFLFVFIYYFSIEILWGIVSSASTFSFLLSFYFIYFYFLSIETLWGIGIYIYIYIHIYVYIYIYIHTHTHTHINSLRESRTSRHLILVN